MEELHGISLETLADIMTKHGELNAKLGQQQGASELRSYLAGRGLNEQVWSAAHNAWIERFRADPTGMLEAQFHQMLSQRTMKAHFGDVRDMSADQLEGVTLDQYAQLSVAMGKPGVDADAVARAHGLSGTAQWTAASAAWGAKMAADTTFALSTQFGALYQKHAGPAFAQAQLQQTADILASSNAPREVAPSKAADLSQPTLLAELRSQDPDVRWKAARWLAHQWKKGDPGTEANLACIPVLIEILERHDERTVSNAEDAVGKLARDLAQFTPAVKSAMSMCLNRAKEKLGSLEAAFAPIRDKAVPERVTLQARIQEYQSLIGTLEGALRSWPAEGRAPAAAVGMTMPTSTAKPKGKFPFAVLLVLPVLAAGGYFLLHRHAEASAAKSAAAAAAPPPKKGKH
jgi:hypothetical protein